MDVSWSSVSEALRLFRAAERHQKFEVLVLVSLYLSHNFESRRKPLQPRLLRTRHMELRTVAAAAVSGSLHIIPKSHIFLDPCSSWEAGR